MINWIKWNKGKFFTLIILFSALSISFVFYNIISKSGDSLSSIGRAAVIDKCESINCLMDVINSSKDTDLIAIVNEVKSINKLLINQPDEIREAGGYCKILGEAVGYRLASSIDLKTIGNFIDKIDTSPSSALDSNRYMCQNSILRGLSMFIVENYDREKIENILLNLCEKPSGRDGDYRYIFDFKNNFCSFQLTGSLVSSVYSKFNLNKYSDVSVLCNSVDESLVSICLKSTLANLVVSKESIVFTENDCLESKMESYCNFVRGIGSTFLLKNKITENDFNEINFYKDVCQDNQDCLLGIYNAAGNIYGASICEWRFSSNIDNCLKSFFTDITINSLIFNTLRGEDLANKICNNDMYSDRVKNLCISVTNSIFNYRYKNGII